MVNGAASISWCSVLTDVLNAPITELTVSNDVDAIQDLGDARTLFARQSLVSLFVGTSEKRG